MQCPVGSPGRDHPGWSSLMSQKRRVLSHIAEPRETARGPMRENGEYGEKRAKLTAVNFAHSGGKKKTPARALQGALKAASCRYREAAEMTVIMTPTMTIQQNTSQIILRSETRRCPQFGQRMARFETTCPHAGQFFRSFWFWGAVGLMSCPHAGHACARFDTPLPHAGHALSHVVFWL